MSELPSRTLWTRSAARLLTEAGVDSPRLSAELLLFHVCGIDRLELTLHPDVPLSPGELDRLAGLLRRRAEGEPAAYLLGEKEFFGRDFRVTPATLIPRPETELLVETALAAFPADSAVRFADLGTGSGCIAVTLCAERRRWRGVMADISGRALAVAERNAVRHTVRDRLQPVRADFTSPLFLPGSLDLLASNPPYVSREEYETLSPEVRDFEPVTALVPGFVDDDRDREAHVHADPVGGIPNADGRQGLEHLLAVAAEAAEALRPGGLLLMEHGWTQSGPLRLSLKSHIWENVTVIKDLAGHDRLILARRAG